MDGWELSPPTYPRPRRKPLGIFQFSLRTFLVVTALVAAFFGGRASMVPRIEAERAKRLQAERIAQQVEAQRLARVRQAAHRVMLFNSGGRPFIRVERPGDGIERAERVNLWQHQQRYRRRDLIPEQLPNEGRNRDFRLR
jgi:hypothetical protein